MSGMYGRHRVAPGGPGEPRASLAAARGWIHQTSSGRAIGVAIRRVVAEAEKNRGTPRVVSASAQRRLQATRVARPMNGSIDLTPGGT